jgi:DUF218 domain
VNENEHESIRERIFSYVSPHTALFQSRYALVFGTRHGVSAFADDIVRLYRRSYFDNLIISGGVTPGDTRPEATIMAQELRMRGLPTDIMSLETEATNTGQNVVFGRERMLGVSIPRLLLIGKISSARRYIMTVRKQWPEIAQLCCYRVNYFGCDEQHWWRHREFRTRVITEARKIRTYIALGYISEISIVNDLVL